MSATKVCPTSLELSRAFSEGAKASLHQHLDICRVCSAEWEGLARLQDLAQSARIEPPRPEQVARTRAQVLARARDVRPSQSLRISSAWLGLAAAVATSLVVWVAQYAGPTTQATRLGTPRSPITESIMRATVHAHANAHYVRLGAQPDEIVRLMQGTLSVEVAPLHPGERFRVVTADGEVEVRGTAFDVIANEDRLMQVHVLHGRVEVRPRGAVSAVLNAGDRWEPPPASDTSATHPRNLDRKPYRSPSVFVGKRSPERATNPAHASRDVSESMPSEAEIAFGEGFRALTDGNPASAAAAFERAALAHDSSPVAEDATYWLAVSLGRAGRKSGAAQVFSRFLERYPASPRAGEASAMLGWLLLEDGDLAGAKTRFERAVEDVAPDVGRSARAGLEEVRVRGHR